ncbi:MAG: hypothetical protein A2521_13815 [Deltaproteobacteria bacterium RIFOXYD12_FULL_57_12]|nr:MAG: hypothetical protein A2521_13815 [Deltaproteobacteria bacterium RIFOXYD12_FULL_57_12]
MAFLPSKKWQVFSVVAMGVFMSTLDSSMINIALPAIMKEFHSSLAVTQWVVQIYLLTITVSLLFWGHLGDRLGRNRIYPAGMLLFGVCSLVCSLATQIYWLIIWRFGQGLGAAMMMATGPALIKEIFPPGRLGRSLGLIGVAVSAGLMAGPSLGGFLVEYFSWRSLFFVTAPLGLLYAVLATLVLPKTPAASLRKFDLAGSSTWAVGIACVTLALSLRATGALLLLGLGLFSIILFLRHEARTAQPILPVALFRKRFFSTAVLSSMLSFAVLYAVIILIPFFLDRVQGLTATRIGMIMLAIPLAALMVGPPAGWLSDYIGARLLTTLGFLISTAGLLFLTGLTAETPPLSVALRLAFLGCGQAMFLSPNSASVLKRVGNHQAGISAGLLATARNLGMLLGVAQAGFVFAYFYARHTGGLDLKDFTPDHIQPFLTALRASFLSTAAIGLCGVFASWQRGPTRQDDNPDPES